MHGGGSIERVGSGERVCECQALYFMPGPASYIHVEGLVMLSTIFAADEVEWR